MDDADYKPAWFKQNGERRSGKAQRQPASVFLSYSRKDQARAGKIVKALSDTEVRVFRDTDDILPTEEWKQRLGQLIASADAFLLLLSPNSVASEVCAWEAEYATSLKKRIIPVLLDEVDSKKVTPLVSRLNFIQLPATMDPASAAETITKVLNTDISWLRENTRLLGLALRWQEAGHRSSLLLRGQDINAAERWRDLRPSNSPEIASEISAFVAASRGGAVRRQRTLVGISAATVVLMAILAGFAWIQMGEAQSQRNVAQAQTRAAELRLADNMVIQANSLLAEKALPKAKRQFERAQEIYVRNTGSTLGADLGWMAATEVTPEPVRRLLGASGAISTLAVSADGDLIVAGDRKGQVTAWRAGEDRPAFQAYLKGDVLAIAIPAEGDLLVATLAGELFALSRKDGAVRKSIPLDPEQGAVTTATAGSAGIVVAQFRRYTKEELDLAEDVEGSFIARYNHAGEQIGNSRVLVGQRVASLAPVKDEASRLVAGVTDGTILLDFEDANFAVTYLAGFSKDDKVHQLIGAYVVRAVAVDSQHAEVISAGSDGALDVHSIDPTDLAAVKAKYDKIVQAGSEEEKEFAAAQRKLKRFSYKTFEGGIYSLDASDYGVAVGFGNGDLALFTRRDGERRFAWRISDGTASISSLVSYLDGSRKGGPAARRLDLRIIAGDEDGVVRVWAPYRKPSFEVRLGGVGLMPMPDFSVDGNQLLAANQIDGDDLKTWRLGETTPLHSLPLSESMALGGARFAGGPDQVWIAYEDGRVAEVALNGRSTLRSFRLSSGAVALATAEGGRRVVALAADGQVVSFGTGATWTRAASDSIDGNAHMSISANGRRILVSHGKGVTVMEGESGRVLWERAFEGASKVWSSRLSDDGKTFVLGHQQGHVSLWTTEPFRELWNVVGHGSVTTTVAFAPASTAVVSGSREGAFRVWSALDGQQLFERTGLAPIEDMAVSREGVLALSVMGDNDLYGDVDVIVLRTDLAHAAAERRSAFGKARSSLRPARN